MFLYLQCSVTAKAVVTRPNVTHWCVLCVGVQGLWRRAVWLPGAEGVTERGGSHSVYQANLGRGELPTCQKNRPLWPQGLSTLLHRMDVFTVENWAEEESWLKESHCTWWIRPWHFVKTTKNIFHAQLLLLRVTQHCSFGIRQWTCKQVLEKWKNGAIKNYFERLCCQSPNSIPFFSSKPYLNPTDEKNKAFTKHQYENSYL